MPGEEGIFSLGIVGGGGGGGNGDVETGFSAGEGGGVMGISIVAFFLRTWILSL